MGSSFERRMTRMRMRTNDDEELFMMGLMIMMRVMLDG